MKARSFLALIPLGIALVLTGCAGWLHSQGELLTLHSREPQAKLVGNENCTDCHSTIASFFDTSIHKQNLGCETCHGPGDMHVSDGPGHITGVNDLQSMSAHGKSSMCTSCHLDRRASFPQSEHAKAGVTCFQCHTDAVHFKQEGGIQPPKAFADEPSRFCAQCHAATVSETAQAYRHPMEDGEVACADCHTVHGEDALRPEKRAVAACSKCHADEAGPKVFRHAALDDGCQACHAPHGAPTAALLKENGNALCLSCHLEPGFPVIAGVDHSINLAAGAQCLDCHVEIHGSNSDPSLLGRIR